MRAVSVRVNEVIGVAGYVLPGTRVDVVATPSPTNQPVDTVSKVVLANVQVLTAGTRMEQDQKDGKPVQVTVVTLLVTPEQAERLALASTEGQDSARAAQPDRPGRARDARASSRPSCSASQGSRARRRAPRPGEAWPGRDDGLRPAPSFRRSKSFAATSARPK